MYVLGGLVRLLVGLSFVACAVPGHAQIVRLATGDYPPLAGEGEPGGGLLSQAVVAAFSTQGANARLSFLPWQRGFNETRNGDYTATFPYVKNPEREVDFLFSKVLYSDNILMFGLSSLGAKPQWAGKSICIPLGYNTLQVQRFVQAHAAQLARPASMLDCFQLLQVGRVQAVWASETVAEHITRPLRAAGLKYKPLYSEVDYTVDYFLIVPKRQPDAATVVQRFNTGLAEIRKSGLFKKIMTSLNP